MKNILLLLASSGILLASCKDDTAFGIKAVGNRRNVLTSHTWKLTKLTEIGVDVELKPCQLDDIYVFETNSTGYMDEGAISCGNPTPVDTTNPGDTTVIVSKSTIGDADNIQYDDSTNQRISFTWEVPGDQRELKIYNFGSSDLDWAMEIEEMDDTHIRVRGSERRNGKLIVFFKEFTAY
jgi:hypothetical protein